MTVNVRLRVLNSVFNAITCLIGKYHRYHAPCRFIRDNKTSRQHDFMSCREGLVIRDLTIRRDLRKNGEGYICTIKEPIFKLSRRSIRVKGSRTLRHENIVGSFSIHRLINQTKSLVV